MTKPKKNFSLLSGLSLKRKALMVSLCSISILAFALGLYVSQHLIYEVYVDDVSIGYVNSYDEYESALSSIEETDGAQAAEKISVKRTVAVSQISEDLSYLNDVHPSALTYANYMAGSEGTASGYSAGQAVASELEEAAKAATETLKDETEAETEVKAAESQPTPSEESSSEETAEPSPESLNEEASSEEAETEAVSQASLVQDESSSSKTAQDNSEEKLLLSSVAIESRARQLLNLKQPSAALIIDGVQIASLASLSDANSVIQKVKDFYTPTEEGTSVLSVTISEEVTTAEVYEAEENILSPEAATEKILSGTPDPQVYTIADGDTIWDIAMTNGIKTNDIQSSNPDIDINSIHIGDEITLPFIKNYVHVEVNAEVTTQEAIQYSTKEVSDKTLLTGKTKVTQSGENGLQEIVTNVTVVNGITTSQDILSTTTIKEAVDKVVAVGTKAAASSSSTSSTSSTSSGSSSSGSSASSSGFIRPASGILTSNYGYRSSGFHTGIDLAASTGTKVVASKAGKVTFSGWKGNYGYCVIIDHGNGISTLYAHNSSLKVSAGDSVLQGQTIALMGSTGNSTGPHCHFEIRVNGAAQNPWNYIN